MGRIIKDKGGRRKERGKWEGRKWRRESGGEEKQMGRGRRR